MTAAEDATFAELGTAAPGAAAPGAARARGAGGRRARARARGLGRRRRGRDAQVSRLRHELALAKVALTDPR